MSGSSRNTRKGKGGAPQNRSPAPAKRRAQFMAQQKAKQAKRTEPEEEEEDAFEPEEENDNVGSDDDRSDDDRSDKERSDSEEEEQVQDGAHERADNSQGINNSDSQRLIAALGAMTRQLGTHFANLKSQQAQEHVETLQILTKIFKNSEQNESANKEVNLYNKRGKGTLLEKFCLDLHVLSAVEGLNVPPHRVDTVTALHLGFANKDLAIMDKAVLFENQNRLAYKYNRECVKGALSTKTRTALFKRLKVSFPTQPASVRDMKPEDITIGKEMFVAKTYRTLDSDPMKRTEFLWMLFDIFYPVAEEPEDIQAKFQGKKNIFL